MRCWLLQHGVWEGPGQMPKCDGALIKCHLIPKQQLRKAGLSDEAQNTAVWVPACGGPMGNAGHHGHLDSSRKLRVPFSELPDETLDFAERYELMWWLEREYH